MQGSLPRRLRVLRAERGLTLRDAAESIGIRPATLSQMEQGHTHPRDITLSRVAKAYGVSVGSLIDEAEDIQAPKAQAPSSPPPAEEAVPDEERRELYSAADKFSSDTTRGTPPIAFDDLVTLRERIQRLGDTHRTLRKQHEESGPLPVSDWAYELEAVIEKLWRDGVEAALEYKGLAPVKHGGVADVRHDWKAAQLKLKAAFDDLVNLQAQARHLASQKKTAAGYSEATMERAAEAVLDREAQRQKETR